MIYCHSLGKQYYSVIHLNILCRRFIKVVQEYLKLPTFQVY